MSAGIKQQSPRRSRSPFFLKSIGPNGEDKRVALLLQKVLGLRQVLKRIRIHREHFQPIRLSPLQSRGVCQRRQARRAPGCPEIKDDQLAPIAAKINRRASLIFDVRRTKFLVHRLHQPNVLLRTLEPQFVYSCLYKKPILFVAPWKARIKLLGRGAAIFGVLAPCHVLAVRFQRFLRLAKLLLHLAHVEVERSESRAFGLREARINDRCTPGNVESNWNPPERPRK